jgi:hypothetical protein
MNDAPFEGILERIKERGLEDFRHDVAKAPGRARVALLFMALLCCCQNRMPVPPWLAEAFRDAFSQWFGLHVDSLDEAFGLPLPTRQPGRRQKARRRSELSHKLGAELVLLDHIGGWVDWLALSRALRVPTDVLKDLMEQLLFRKMIPAASKEQGGEARVLEGLVREFTGGVEPLRTAHGLSPGKRWALRAGQAKVRSVLQALQGKLADVESRRKTRKGRVVYWEDLEKDLGSYHHELQSLFTKGQLFDLFPRIALRERGR